MMTPEADTDAHVLRRQGSTDHRDRPATGRPTARPPGPTYLTRHQPDPLGDCMGPAVSEPDDRYVIDADEPRGAPQTTIGSLPGRLVFVPTASGTRCARRPAAPPPEQPYPRF
jgi:hypothetical protein